MKNKPWQFKAAAGGALTIELFDQIGDDFFGEGTTAKSFSQELADAGPGITAITLKISSPGGNVWDGLAIFDLLLRHRAAVTAEVMFAASIASVIAMSAQKISMAATGVMMVHLPGTAVAGNANDMRKMAATLDTVTESMIVAYRRHTSKTPKEIEALLAEETWFSASEAVAAGFAEEVFDPEEADDDEPDLAAVFRAPITATFHLPPGVAQIAARLGGQRPAVSEPDAGISEGERLRLAARARLALQRRLPDDGN